MVMEALLQHMTQLVTVKDASLVYRELNPFGENLFGRTRAEVVGKTDLDLFVDGAERQERDRWVLAQNVAGTAEETLGTRIVKMTRVPVDGSLLTIGEDITDAKQAAERATLATKELVDFTYSVSHDLRAPLRGIDGFSRILLEGHTDNLDERGRQLLERVRAAAQRMSTLIDDLVQLSRVSRVTLQPSRVNVSALSRQIVAELRRKAPERHIEVEVADDIVVEADPSLVRAVLEHLLGNAWKFTAKKETARVWVSATVADGMVEIMVRDDGAGFDQTYAGKLFGAFQRLHAQHEFEGVGIGLATAQRIVHRHGGTMRAVGEVGLGASFYFTLRSV